MIGQLNNNMIFVVINYCVGVFGFLVGEFMERDGFLNVGLYD